MKTIDIRIAVRDGEDARDALLSIASQHKWILGVQELRNDGFGHLMPSGDPFITANDPVVAEVARKALRPITG